MELHFKGTHHPADGQSAQKTNDGGGPSPPQPNGVTKPEDALAWRQRAGELAKWGLLRLVIRTDVWGGYTPTCGRVTRPRVAARGKVSLTGPVLERSFAATRTQDVAGVHTTSADGLCLWGGPDIDRHGDHQNPAANLAAALHWHARLVRLGFRPLLTASNGCGGYHLRVLLASRVPSEQLYDFLHALTADRGRFGFSDRKDLEIFPKQRQLRTGKRCGNWLRLPGRHHTRDYWSEVFDGQKWLAGHAAIGHILGFTGDDPRLLDQLQPPTPPPRPRKVAAVVAPGHGKGGGDAVERYARKALDLELTALLSAPEGDRNNQLNHSAFALGQFVGAGALDRSEVECSLAAVARSIGLSEGEIMPTIKSGMEAGEAQPRDLSGVGGRRYEPGGHNGVAVGQGGLPTSQPPAAERAALKVVQLTRVEARRKEWLWDRWLPRGTVTVFDGDPGLGKSTISTALTARVSRGWAMPPGPGGSVVCEPAPVLILSAEDDAAATIRPRLDAAGADPDRVFLAEAVTVGDAERPAAIPVDLNLVEDAIRQHGVKLVVIDPLMAFLDDTVNAHKDQDIRRCLHEMKLVAERTGVAFLIVRHLNKVSGASALYRGGGSIGIIGAARAAWVAGRDPADPSRRVLAMNKCNLAAHPRSLVYSLDTRGDVASVGWRGECDLTADDILAQPGKGNKADDCEGYLRDVLSDGPVLSNDAEKRCKQKGFSKATFRRACQQAGVERRKERRFDGQWSIYIPPEDGGDGDNRTGGREDGGLSNFAAVEGAQPPATRDLSIFDEMKADLRSDEDAHSEHRLSNIADKRKPSGNGEGAQGNNGLSNFAAPEEVTAPGDEGAQVLGTEHLEHLRAPGPGEPGVQETEL